MKNLIKILWVLIFSWSWQNSFSQNTYPSSGTVNLGTSTSTGAQGIIVKGKNDARIKLIADDNNVGEYYNPYVSFSQDGGTVSSVIGHVGNAGKDPQDQTYTSTLANTFLVGTKTAYPLQLGTNKKVRFTVTANGDVGIGTIVPKSKLAVKGTIRAKELKVMVDINADFVFEEDYDLRSLKEVEEFIKTNNHLPEIPSAEEMKELGISVGEMNIKLLQKIEELTLYLIQQEKRLIKQEANIQALQSKISTLNK